MRVLVSLVLIIGSLQLKAQNLDPIFQPSKGYYDCIVLLKNNQEIKGKALKIKLTKGFIHHFNIIDEFNNEYKLYADQVNLLRLKDDHLSLESSRWYLYEKPSVQPLRLKKAVLMQLLNQGTDENVKLYSYNYGPQPIPKRLRANYVEGAVDVGVWAVTPNDAQVIFKSTYEYDLKCLIPKEFKNLGISEERLSFDYILEHLQKLDQYLGKPK